MQHRNCVVELSYLDLEREKEGGKAGAQQHVARQLRGCTRRVRGAALRGLLPKGVVTRWLCGEARVCLSLLDLGTLCVSRAQFPSCTLWWEAAASSQKAAVPVPGPPQAPAHGMAPPYPPQSTRQSLLGAPTIPHRACTAFPRKPLPPTISSVTALNSLCTPAPLSCLLQKQNCCHSGEGG